MLFQGTILKGKEIGYAEGDSILLNTSRIIQFDLANDDDTGFLYDMYSERRGTMPYVEISDTVDEVTAEFNTTPTAQVINLLVYPNNDAAKTAEAKYISINDIVIGSDSGADSDNSWIWIVTSNKMYKLLSSLSLSEIVEEVTSSVPEGATYDEEGYLQIDEEGYYELDED